MNMRSVAAIFGGLVTNLLAVPVDAALGAIGVWPVTGGGGSQSPFALALAYRTALAVLGGWVTARLAPAAPTRHAALLGGLGVLFAGAGAAAQWPLGHHWYALSLVVMSLPATLAGARLLTRS